jgi:hypothetical protein
MWILNCTTTAESRCRRPAPIGTHTEEFYQVTPCSLEMKNSNRELPHWGKIYNTVRPLIRLSAT